MSAGYISTLTAILRNGASDQLWTMFNLPTLQETNISPKNGILKTIFLFPRWDMLIPWRVLHDKKNMSSGVLPSNKCHFLPVAHLGDGWKWRWFCDVWRTSRCRSRSHWWRGSERDGVALKEFGSFWRIFFGVFFCQWVFVNNESFATKITMKVWNSLCWKQPN